MCSGQDHRREVGLSLRELTVHVGDTQIGCPEIDATWRDVQMASVDLEKAQPMPSQGGGQIQIVPVEGRGGEIKKI